MCAAAGGRPCAHSAATHAWSTTQSALTFKRAASVASPHHPIPSAIALYSAHLEVSSSELCSRSAATAQERAACARRSGLAGPSSECGCDEPRDSRSAGPAAGRVYTPRRAAPHAATCRAALCARSFAATYLLHPSFTIRRCDFLT